MLAGAGAAALAAVAAEVAGHQAGIRYGIRAAWLAAAIWLLGRVARDTFAVLAALAKTVAGGVPPAAPSGSSQSGPATTRRAVSPAGCC